MIIGIGTDLTDINRIRKSIDRFGTRFIERIFTSAERETAEQRKDPASAYAKRFAAKEACAKALGTGFADGVLWSDMGVVNLQGGKPAMALTGGAAERLRSLTPKGHEAFVHLTLTDEFPYAQAFVVIEARAIT